MLRSQRPATEAPPAARSALSVDVAKLGRYRRAVVQDEAHGKALDEVAALLVERRRGVALTGAGISVPSGIPDFRSPGGLWDRFDPMEYATIDTFLADPEKVWRMLIELDQLVTRAQPNPAHDAVAALEAMGLVDGVITQNIDNLHQDAGSAQVIEFHGNGRRLVCLGCQQRYDASQREELGMPPRCACGQLLKPDVVFFGEGIPEQALSGATALAQSCGVMLVIGTSATVVPCSMIPHMARRGGAALVELNTEPTELTSACDYAIHGDAAQTLPQLVERVRQQLDSPGGPRA